MRLDVQCMNCAAGSVRWQDAMLMVLGMGCLAWKFRWIPNALGI